MSTKFSKAETETLEVKPAPVKGLVLNSHGVMMPVPKGWGFLPPGDAALSRRIKKDGPSWTVKVFKKGRYASQGIWAPKKRIEALRADLLAERATPEYKKKLEKS